MTVEEIIAKLQRVKQCKLDIKQALTSKGVDMSSAPFTSYASKIDEVSTSPLITYGGMNLSGTSQVIDFKTAKKVRYTSVSVGGNYEYKNTVTLQGSNDNLLWNDDTSYSSDAWGTGSYQTGESNGSYRYWRINHNVTKEGVYSRTTTTIGSIETYTVELAA